MATSALAKDIVFALRQQIAKIEGALPERLAAPDKAEESAVIVRRHGVAAHTLLQIGVEEIDAALGGGLEAGALTELHGRETRDAGASAGFVLCLVSLWMKAATAAPFILWIGTEEVFREAGFPYGRGILGLFGIPPENLLFAAAPKPSDALWIAEEAAVLSDFAAVIVELRGSPRALDLTATRRLHRRAQKVGRPVFLLRQGAVAEPTAAPVRFVLSASAAGLRETLDGPLPLSIGPPGFEVEISKSRAAASGRFVLEWNADERIFEDRRRGRFAPPDRGALVSLSGGGQAVEEALGAVVAFGQSGARAAHHQPSREQHTAHLRPRRAS
ncbi:hypothetical protein QBK99_18865 [Corticibacterium sp. UT-5YL-CI-8]|nr:hypothetical protein [Tianweitania sp. UT-5YL-CI-8]